MFSTYVLNIKHASQIISLIDTIHKKETGLLPYDPSMEWLLRCRPEAFKLQYVIVFRTRTLFMQDMCFWSHLIVEVEG